MMLDLCEGVVCGSCVESGGWRDDRDVVERARGVVMVRGAGAWGGGGRAGGVGMGGCVRACLCVFDRVVGLERL